jgi:hypothetical protein
MKIDGIIKTGEEELTMAKKLFKELEEKKKELL